VTQNIELRVVSTDSDQEVTTIRTNRGVEVARKLAQFELQTSEVHISCIFEVVPGGERIQRKRGELPSDTRTTYDYIFSTSVNRRPLPDWFYAKQEIPTTDEPPPRSWSRCKTSACGNKECRWAGVGLCYPCALNKLGGAEMLRRYEATRADDGESWSGKVYGE